MLSNSVVSDSLQSHGLQPARLLCPCNFPGKNTGVGCHFLLKGIFLTQGLNPDLLHWQVNSLTLSHREAPNSGALAQIKTVTQIWSLYNIHSRKKKPVLIKNVLDEAVKITDFIKNLLLNIYLLNTRCGKMANIYKALLLNTEYDDCVEKRYLCKALNHELTAVFHGTSFHADLKD